MKRMKMTMMSKISSELGGGRRGEDSVCFSIMCERTSVCQNFRFVGTCCGRISMVDEIDHDSTIKNISQTLYS